MAGTKKQQQIGMDSPKKQLYLKLCRVVDQLQERHICPRSVYYEFKGKGRYLWVPGSEEDIWLPGSCRDTFMIYMLYPSLIINVEKVPLDTMKRLLKLNERRLENIKNLEQQAIDKYPGDYAAVAFEGKYFKQQDRLEEFARIQVQRLMQSYMDLHPKLAIREVNISVEGCDTPVYQYRKSTERGLNISITIPHRKRIEELSYWVYSLLYSLEDIKQALGITEKD